MLRRFFCLVAFASSLLVLTNCAGHKAERLAVVPPKAAPMSTTTTTIDREGLGKWLHGLQVALWTKNAAGVKQGGKSSQGVRSSRPAAAPAPRIEIGTAISAVMSCIRAHESGDYNEHSHPGGSSGAYQYEPSTWQYWSAQAGYPGYAYAYEAPASVQDAVTAYALTHGGAGNWSTRYGNDPCTQGMS